MRMNSIQHTKRGQISTEVIYSVGVLVVIFLLLTGITFNRKIDIRRTEDYMNKRAECLKISNTLSSVSASGHGTARTIKVDYNVTISNQSRITVSETGATPRTIEAVCTYTGNVNDNNIGAALYTFINNMGMVQVSKAS